MRAVLAVAVLALGGCSLIFDPSSYEHDDAAGFRDAGTDAGLPDAGPPPCDATQPCCSWLDCEGDATRPYCAYDEPRASWSCVAECADDLDCVGYVAGSACLLESGAGVCGCRHFGHCGGRPCVEGACR